MGRNPVRAAPDGPMHDVQAVLSTSLPQHPNRNLLPKSHHHIISDDPMSYFQLLESALGFIYIVASIVTSFIYLDEISPSLANDMWWPGFNATGTQVFLGDIVNHFMALSPSKKFSLLDEAATTRNSYHISSTSMKIYPVYARMLTSRSTTNLADAIQSLHSSNLNSRLPTQYCYADFDKRYELAHTEKRQLRCATKYADNGAVYVEAVIRNIVWNEWYKTFAGPGGSFTTTMLESIAKTPSGLDWFYSMQGAYVNVIAETTFWRQNNISRWQVLWHNCWQPGVAETITISSALSIRQDILVKKIPYFARGSGWRSFVLTSSVLYDMSYAQQHNYSLVRGSVNAMPPHLYIEVSGIIKNPSSELFMAEFGPYGSFDTFWLPLPTSLADLVSDFNIKLSAMVEGNATFRDIVANFTNFETSPTPPRWAIPHLSYLGGSPMCGNGAKTTYLQASFGFDDTCLSPEPFIVDFTTESVLFASTALSVLQGAGMDEDNYRSICSLSYQTQDLCYEILSLLSTNLQITVSSSVHVVHDVASLQMFQFGFREDTQTHVLLQQNVLDSSNSSWNFYGWIMLYEWAIQVREAVEFEGDHASLHLISKPYEPLTIIPKGLEISDRAGKYIIFSVAYVSILMALVATIMFGFGIATNFRVLGRNLFRFNRIVGSVWVGRLMLLIRGMTALVLLSTPSIKLSYDSNVSRFVRSPLTLFSRWIVISESTWVTYVAQDVLILCSKEYAYIAAPFATILTWLVLLLVQELYPLEPLVTLDRTCVTEVIARQVVCHVGVIQFGQVQHVVLMLLAQLGCVVIVLLIFVVFQWKRPTPPVTLLMSAPSEAYLDATFQAKESNFDRVTCVMSGLLSFRVINEIYIFDLKSWRILDDSSLSMNTCNRRRHTCTFQAPQFESVQNDSKSAVVGRLFHTRDKIFAFCSLGYMISSLGGHILYISSTGVNMVNDFWWPEFNATGAYAFLGSWYNMQLHMNPNKGVCTLDTPEYADYASYNTSSSIISTSPAYALLVQSEVISELSVAIRGLRSLNGCDLPLIMTQYCWLDLLRQFPIAFSSQRQTRCYRYTANGAVYLETSLRNVGWNNFYSCWNKKFDAAFGNDLMKSSDGRAWLSKIQTSRVTTVDEEIFIWRGYGIEAFQTQFQNFKDLGMHETFMVQNAMGLSYPMTIKNVKPSIHFVGQTSLKLYWTLHLDLNSLEYFPGQSLMPMSPQYLLTNDTTMEYLLTIGEIISQPFGPPFSSLRTILGPFGTIDAWHVPIPQECRQVYSSIVAPISKLVATNPNAQLAFYNLSIPTSWTPCPSDWQGIQRYSGSVLCDDFMTTSSTTMLSFWSNTDCNSKAESINYPSRLSTLIASMASTPTDLKVTCTSETQFADLCQELLRQALVMAQTYFSYNELEAFNVSKKEAQKAIELTRVSMLQFSAVEGKTLLRGLFDPITPEFDYFSWLLAIEWLIGKREVVSFEGDVGTMVLLSTVMFPIDTLPNPLEIPRNVALYSRYIVLYITVMLFLVALLVTIQLLLSRAKVEAMNVLEINQVAGIIWAGRPFIFVRSVVAISLLSTGDITLHQVGPVGLMTMFESQQFSWYTTMLTSSEVIWLVYILGDIATLFTHQFCCSYATKAAILSWLGATLLSFFSPVTHYVTVDRQCTASHLDFALECNAGTVYIGSVTRFWLLITYSILCMVVCYAYERLYRVYSKNQSSNSSLFLSAGAHYFFTFDAWTYKKCIYLDKASAVISGLLCLEYQGRYYILDIKLWRFFELEVPRELQILADHPMYPRVEYTVPLVGV